MLKQLERRKRQATHGLIFLDISFRISDRRGQLSMVFRKEDRVGEKTSVVQRKNTKEVTHV
jgi:hypothetical protein